MHVPILIGLLTGGVPSSTTVAFTVPDDGLVGNLFRPADIRRLARRELHVRVERRADRGRRRRRERRVGKREQHEQDRDQDSGRQLFEFILDMANRAADDDEPGEDSASSTNDRRGPGSDC